MENAAKTHQVRTRERRDKSRETREANDLRVVLSTPEGRRFLWRVLGHCGVNQSVTRDGFDQRMAYRSGQQDVGHFIQSEIVAAHESAYLTMQREAWANSRKDSLEETAEAEAREAVDNDHGQEEL